MSTKFQVGVKDQSVYETPVTVDRFFEFNSEGIKPQTGRVRSKGLRSGTHVHRKDRQVPYKMGAAGPVELEVLSKGFGFWLKHMLGAVATSGPSGDGAYTHTGTIDTLLGDHFTLQSNHPLHPADTDQPFTYAGGKVPKWAFKCGAGDPLVVMLDLDFMDFATATALASVSYPSTMTLLTFIGGTITVGGSQVDVTSCEVGMDNKLKTDRQYVRGSALKKEPVGEDFREISWKFGCDFESLTQFNRYAATSVNGEIATIVLAFQGPTLIGGSTYPSLTVTIDEASFDDFDSKIDGPAPLSQELSGSGAFDGTTSAVTLAYVTADSTP